MKNKNKGFSLIELLAVIVILGIVALISYGIYNGVQTTVLESELDNLIYQIEQAASDYGFNTSSATVNVETLIKQGYLSADENGEIVNPTTGEALNCYIVTIEYIQGNYTAKFGSVSEVDGSCVSDDTTITGAIVVKNESGEIVSPNEFDYYNENLVLSYDSSIDGIDANIVSYSWTSVGGSYGKEDTINVETDNYLNTVYTVVVTYDNGQVKTTNASIKIDKEEPRIVNINNSDSWINTNRSITLEATDLTGSGVNSFIYTEESTKTKTVLKADDGSLTLELSAGTYSVSAVDNAGNESQETSFTVVNIDKEAPTIENVDITLTNNNMLTINAIDTGGSEVKGYLLTTNASCPTNGYSLDINLSATGSYKLCVIDYAGNTDYEDVTINTLTYEYENGDIDKTLYYLANVSNYSFESPEKTGYNFDSWQVNNVVVTNALNLSGNVSLIANYNFEDMPISVVKYNEESMDIVSKIHLIFVVDESGSMSGTNTSDVKEAVTYIMNNTEFSEDSIFSIVGFESDGRYILSYSNSASTVISKINTIYASGGTDFNDGLSYAKNIATGSYSSSSFPDGFDEENTYVIFLSDGNGTYTSSNATTLKQYVNSIYTVGIGSGVDEDDLKDMATVKDGVTQYYYYAGTSNMDSLIDIFVNITEDIAENETINTLNGKYELPDLVVSADRPFTLVINAVEYNFSSISKLNELLTIIDGVYYLNLGLIDEKYGLGANITSLKVTYYYN